MRSVGERKFRRFPIKVFLAILAATILLLILFKKNAPSRELADEIISEDSRITPSKQRDPASLAASNCFREPPAPNSIALGGTLLLSNVEDSIALLSISRGPGIAVRTGEAFAEESYQVSRIARGRICLVDLKKKRTFTVKMSHEKPAASAISIIAKAVGIIHLGENEISVPNGLIKRELMDLNTLLSSAAAIPEPSGTPGKLAGFRLSSVDPTSLFLALGLKTNDVIIAVNKIAMDNAGKALMAFQTLQGTSKVELDLIRDGKKKTLTFTRY